MMDDDIMDQVLVENTFHCTHCKSLLRIPVMLVEEKGNMCFACYEHYRAGNNVVALENTALVNILKKMKIPCEYKSQGCDQNLLYEDFYMHKDQCIHQTVGCKIVSDCPWTGSLHKLITQCEQDHKDRVLTSSDDCYKLFQIQDIREGFYILKTSHGTFIVNMMKSSRHLRILIYDSDQCEKMCEHPAIIKFVTVSGDEYKKKCMATKDLKAFILFNDNSAININLDHIREFLGEDTKIEVIIGLIDHSKIPEEMQEELSCSNCGLYMKSNAYTCSNLHNLCGLCKKQMKCPICLTAVIKNILLEKLATQTRFPCRYKNAGCMMKIAANSNHEDTCTFRTWSCFLLGCFSHLHYPGLILHALNNHKIPKGLANSFYMSKSLVQAGPFYVIEHQFFELIFENGADEIKWSVSIVGSDDPHIYIYTFEVEIDFGNTHTPPIKGIRLRGPCGSVYDFNSGVISTKYPITLSRDTLWSLCHASSTDLWFKVRVFKEA